MPQSLDGLFYFHMGYADVYGKVNVRFCKGIYFLFFGKEIVYIGASSKSCMGRISSHFDEGAKVFDRFKIKPMLNSKDSDIFELEKHLIKKYLPKYNVVHATNGDEAWKPQSLLTKKDIAPLIERKFSRLKTKHPKDFERRVSSYRSSMEWIDFVQSQIRVYPYCQKCGKDNKELKVYHSNPISLFNETNEDVSVMCLACGDGYGVMRIY